LGVLECPLLIFKDSGYAHSKSFVLQTKATVYDSPKYCTIYGRYIGVFGFAPQ
jgi:hypothetical protein